jgi:Phosphatidylserine/phosphatidylglycerophosphate/cardiolipin synthases and related enzymes
MSDAWRAGNEIELLINGEAFFPRVFESIRKARHEVIIETFILCDDEVGKALQQTLLYAARRGVHVEFTIDAYGGNKVGDEFLQTMADAGIHVHLFEPTRHLFNLRMNAGPAPSGGAQNPARHLQNPAAEFGPCWLSAIMPFTNGILSGITCR